MTCSVGTSPNIVYIVHLNVHLIHASFNLVWFHNRSILGWPHVSLNFCIYSSCFLPKHFHIFLRYIFKINNICIVSNCCFKLLKDFNLFFQSHFHGEGRQLLIIYIYKTEFNKIAMRDGVNTPFLEFVPFSVSAQTHK